MNKYFKFLSLCLITFSANASGSYVDTRDVNIAGQVKEISAPNILKVETYQNKVLKHFWIDLVHVDFGADRDHDCNDSKSKACKRMEDWLLGENVQIELTEWSQPILKGFVFLGSTNINYHLISNGLYRVDYLQTRDASLALLEKKARCKRVGIWKSKLGDPVEDMKCQD